MQAWNPTTFDSYTFQLMDLSQMLIEFLILAVLNIYN